MSAPGTEAQNIPEAYAVERLITSSNMPEGHGKETVPYPKISLKSAKHNPKTVKEPAEVKFAVSSFFNESISGI